MRTVLALCLAAFVAGPAFAAEMPPVHDGISPPAAAWARAMEAGDLAALARMHDGATTTYPPKTREVDGAAAIMKGYADLLAQYRVQVATRDAHWIEVPPLVVSWGLTTLTLHPKAGGTDVVSRTRFTDAAVKTPTGWRYVIDHASVQPQR